MMPLPTIKCPVCHSQMSLDVLLVDDSVRDALMAVIDIHPLGDKFIKPLLRYIGLFSPAKSQMSHGRIAALINEIEPMIKAGKIERNGMIHIAPLDYWQDALNTVLASRDAGKLTLPLKSHGYLLEVISSRANATAAKIEQKNEERTQIQERRLQEAAQNNGHLETTLNAEEHRRYMEKMKSGVPKRGALQNTSMKSIGDIANNLLPPKEKP